MLKPKSKNRKKFTGDGHKQILTEGKYIDKGIATLLQAIWKHGIRTTNSCEENQPGIVWIEFLTIGELNKFLNLIAVYPKKNEIFWKTLYSRIISNSEKDNWKYNINIIDWGVDVKIVGDEAISTFKGKHNLDFTASVRFPKSDLKEILKRLK